MYCLRLTELPPNTNARDLDEIAKKVKAKTWTIPRSKFNYNYLRYAFFNFESEKDQAEAANTQVGLNTTKLAWAEAEAQLCGRCASANHLSKDCPEKRPPINKDFAKLYAKFKPAQFRNFKERRPTTTSRPSNRTANTFTANRDSTTDGRRTYAEVTNNTNRNIKGGTQEGGSMHEFDPIAAHRTVLRQLTDINRQIKKVAEVIEQQEIRIAAIEQVNGIVTTVHKEPVTTSEMEQDGKTNPSTVLTSNPNVEINMEETAIYSINATTRNLQEENVFLRETILNIANKYNELIGVLSAGRERLPVEQIPTLFLESLTQNPFASN